MKFRCSELLVYFVLENLFVWFLRFYSFHVSTITLFKIIVRYTQNFIECYKIFLTINMWNSLKNFMDNFKRLLDVTSTKRQFLRNLFGQATTHKHNINITSKVPHEGCILITLEDSEILMSVLKRKMTLHCFSFLWSITRAWKFTPLVHFCDIIVHALLMDKVS